MTEEKVEEKTKYIFTSAALLGQLKEFRAFLKGASTISTGIGLYSSSSLNIPTDYWKALDQVIAEIEDSLSKD